MRAARVGSDPRVLARTLAGRIAYGAGRHATAISETVFCLLRLAFVIRVPAAVLSAGWRVGMGMDPVGGTRTADRATAAWKGFAQ